MRMHQQMAATLEECVLEIRRLQQAARRSGKFIRPRWPMIVLRTPKGWTGPKQVDGHKVEGFWRSHQVPLSGLHDNGAHLKQLDAWLRSYKPEELFDESGRLIPELKELAPKGPRRMSANPHANGGLLRKPLRMPDFRDYAIEVESARPGVRGKHPPARPVPPRHHAPEHDATSASSAPTKTPRTGSTPSTRSARSSGWPTPCPRTPTAASSRPTAGCWRCSPSTRWRAGWKATCSPAATASSPPTKPSSTSSTRCSTSTPSGWPSPATSLGARPSPR